MSTAMADISIFPEQATTPLSRRQALWGVLKRKPLGIASAALIALLVFTAIFANILALHSTLSTGAGRHVVKPADVGSTQA
jgi:N-terminal TM domain of oligopeptide transport permease C